MHCSSCLDSRQWKVGEGGGGRGGWGRVGGEGGGRERSVTISHNPDLPTVYFAVPWQIPATEEKLKGRQQWELTDDERGRVLTTGKVVGGIE